MHLRHELASLKSAEKNIVGSSTLLIENINTVKKTSIDLLKKENESNQMEIKTTENISSRTSAFSIPTISTTPFNTEETKSNKTNSNKCLDLYMEGLLPALPLLYPYQEITLRHSALIL